MLKKIFILVPAFIFLMASITPAQEVIERYVLGAYIEDISYINTGDFEGKCAFVDGWYVYTLDLNTRAYEKLFYLGDVNIDLNPRGITYISLGDFAGNFLINDGPNPDTLFIVSSSGDLVSEVKASDFRWENWCESITEITSGAYTGCFAMIGFDADDDPHIFIFRIVESDGAAYAYLAKDIPNDNNILDVSNGICFLPDSYPDEAYRNCFVLGYELKVIDYEGTIKGSFGELWEGYEGLTYISNDSYQGNLIVASVWGTGTSLRNLEGTYEEEITFLGIGVSYPYSVNWLASTNKFLFGRAWNYKFWYCSRISPGIWTKDKEIDYPYNNIRSPRDITQLTNDGNHYLLGWHGSMEINGIWVRKYMVQRLNSNLEWQETYELYNDHSGKYFRNICYLPGETPEQGKFALLQYYDRINDVFERNLYLFDKDFSSPPTIIDLSGKVDNSYSSIYYDSEEMRYYVLDGGITLRVFDLSWEEITECDVSHLIPRSFFDLTKITSGDLKGNLALISREDSEIVIVNLEGQIVISQLEKLTEEIQIGDINEGIKTSLVEKLENAKSSIEKGNINAAINKFRAFQNEIQAQMGKKISEELAEEWIAWAEDIIQELENLENH